MFGQNIKEDSSWKTEGHKRKGTKWLCWSSIWICLDYSCQDSAMNLVWNLSVHPAWCHSQRVRYQCFVPSGLIQRHSLEHLAKKYLPCKDSCHFLILWCILRREKMPGGVEGWVEFSFYLEDLVSCLKANVSRFLHPTTCFFCLDLNNLTSTMWVRIGCLFASLQDNQTKYLFEEILVPRIGSHNVLVSQL